MTTDGIKGLIVVATKDKIEKVFGMYRQQAANLMT